jgi:hypothetical protein
MNTAKIEVEVASRSLYLIRYMTSISVALTSAFFLAPPSENSKLVFLLAAVPGWLLVEQLTKKIYLGRLQIEVTKEELIFVWLKPFIIWKKTDRAIKWSEIKEHSYDGSSHLDQFVLTLKNGSKVKYFFRSMSDEFMELYHNFDELAIALSTVDNSVTVKRKVRFTETKAGNWMLFSIGIIIIAFCGYVLHLRPLEEINWIGLIVLTGIGLSLSIPRMKLLSKKNVDNKV